MHRLQKISISAALIVLLCFFLPWLEVSCGGARDALSGVDLARDSRYELWLIPVLMLAVIFFSAARPWRDLRAVPAMVNLAGGLVTAILMNRERAQSGESALLAVRLTIWFWLGLVSAIAIMGAAIFRLLGRDRTT